MKENTTEKYQYMVAAICATFNQSSKIKNTLNGFCIQETDFPVLSMVIDDASTDGEPEVIRSFLNENFRTPFKEEETEDYQLICAYHKTNPNCFLEVVFLKYNHYNIKKSKVPYWSRLANAKYVAFCEGDDYWTDPHKLQKQTDYMEKNPDCVVCSTGYEVHDLSNSTVEDKTIKNDNGVIRFSIADWAKWPNMKTLTVMTKKSAYMNYFAEIGKYKNPKDIYFQYHILMQGNGIYICENMGVYNLNEGGVWSGLTDEEKLLWDYNSYKELYYKNDRDENVRRRYISYIGAIISRPQCEVNRGEMLVEFIKVIRRGEDILRLVRDISCFLLRKLF